MATLSFLYVVYFCTDYLSRRVERVDINRLFLLGDSSGRVRVFGAALCRDSERVKTSGCSCRWWCYTAACVALSLLTALLVSAAAAAVAATAAQLYVHCIVSQLRRPARVQTLTHSKLSVALRQVNFIAYIRSSYAEMSLPCTMLIRYFVLRV